MKQNFELEMSRYLRDMINAGYQLNMKNEESDLLTFLIEIYVNKSFLKENRVLEKHLLSDFEHPLDYYWEVFTRWNFS